MSRGIGLVLAGGGGKGAYHIGVWKALKATGIDKNITAVSGASVGALNCLLLANGSLEIAERVWRTIGPEKIMTLNTGGGDDFCKKRLEENTYAIFSRAGLNNLIDTNINLSRVRNSRIKLFASVTRADTQKIKYMKINGCGDEEIKEIVFASSALPFIYGTQEIDGVKYYDGGLKDNVPVEPLLGLDLSMIIAVHLSKDSVTNKIYKNIIEIVPSDEQGGPINGTLDFSPEGAARRMEQGYGDTMRILQPVLEAAKEGAQSADIAKDILYHRPREARVNREETKRKINMKRRQLNG